MPNAMTARMPHTHTHTHRESYVCLWLLAVETLIFIII